MYKYIINLTFINKEALYLINSDRVSQSSTCAAYSSGV